MGSKIINSLTVILLTYNEEANITYALNSVYGRFSRIIVVDSFSNDSTVKIVERDFPNVKVLKNKFVSYRKQRLWAVKNDVFESDWIFFLDADEIVTDKLFLEIKNLGDECQGYSIFYKYYFMGKRISHGGYSKNFVMRIFRKDGFRISREMNEHVFVAGISRNLKEPFLHIDRKGFSKWITKHIDYAQREALELEEKGLTEGASLFAEQAKRKRWIRERIWKNIPPLIRPILYFFYRYFLRFGFLDGIRGFIFHFFHSFVYILMIDVLFLEKKYARAYRE